MLLIVTIQGRDILPKIQEIRSHAVQTTARAHPILHPLTIRVQADLIAEPDQVDLRAAALIAEPVQVDPQEVVLKARLVPVAPQEVVLHAK